MVRGGDISLLVSMQPHSHPAIVTTAIQKLDRNGNQLGHSSLQRMNWEVTQNSPGCTTAARITSTITVWIAPRRDIAGEAVSGGT